MRIDFHFIHVLLDASLLKRGSNIAQSGYLPNLNRIICHQADGNKARQSVFLRGLNQLAGTYIKRVNFIPSKSSDYLECF